MRSCVRSATFCELAGVDATDHRAALADLPPIDSYSHAGLILRTNLTSPRTEIPIGRTIRDFFIQLPSGRV